MHKCLLTSIILISKQFNTHTQIDAYQPIELTVINKVVLNTIIKITILPATQPDKEKIRSTRRSLEQRISRFFN